MKILVCGINYAPELIGVAKYTTEMCEYFRRAGHEVRVITAPPYYPAWEVVAPYASFRYTTEVIDQVKITRCPLYVPRSPGGLRRILHHLSFAAFSAPVIIATALRFRPDVVLAVAPSLFGAPAAVVAARLVGAATWLHMQDFEIDAAFDLGFLSGSSFRRAALWSERSILKLFDRVSSISPRMVEQLRQKGVGSARTLEFNNWVDTDAIVPARGPTALRASLNVPETATIALYSGNMGTKQGLEYLAAAAERLAKVRPDIVFLFCGFGSMKDRLEHSTRHLSNVRMLGLQPADAFAQLLSTADIHLLPQLPGVMDLALPSKLPGMLASGRPVIAMAKEKTQLHSELDGAGIVVAPGDIDALVAALVKLADDRELRLGLGEHGRHLAVSRWDRRAVLGRIDAQLRELAKQGARRFMETASDPSPQVEMSLEPKVSARSRKA